jgi:xanthine dehydrogenase YagS FAD-binding subunit
MSSSGTTIRFPLTSSEAVAALREGGEAAAFRAGSTDLSERRAHRIEHGPLVDLRDTVDLDRVDELAEGGLRLGAKLRIAQVADDPRLRAGWPAFAAAAGALATPQIRAVGTLGGNVMQRVRCWYYRHPDFECLKKGGAICFARTGDHLYHAVFDLGPCVAPHASTLAMALLAYDARVESLGEGEAGAGGAGALAMDAFLGDGSDPRRENRLPVGHLLRAVWLPPPLFGERSAYFRAIARARAEWPLVEVVARLRSGADGRIDFARVAVGGVATIPLRLTALEQGLLGAPAEPGAFEAAAARAADGCKPLPMTAYKVPLLRASVQEALERAWAAEPVAVNAPPPPPPPEPETKPAPARRRKSGGR